ncbi:MAG: hypothetical protein M3069_31370 [Chloroflexota bacterium]|nr:hypothetical protein [Chloroflexota bacterium]
MVLDVASIAPAASRRIRVALAVCGVGGVALLSPYFLPRAPVPPAGATADQITAFATQVNLYLGTWLQATGTLLCVIFFLGLVHIAGAATTFAGRLTLLASGSLVAVILIEGALTVSVAQAAATGHTQTALTSWEMMAVFIRIIPIVPAPAVFLSLGSVLLGSRVLPVVFAYLALVIGVGFEVMGFASVFSSAALVTVILLLVAMIVWILAAAITLVVREGRTGMDSQQRQARVLS